MLQIERDLCLFFFHQSTSPSLNVTSAYYFPVAYNLLTLREPLTSILFHEFVPFSSVTTVHGKSIVRNIFAEQINRVVSIQ